MVLARADVKGWLRDLGPFLPLGWEKAGLTQKKKLHRVAREAAQGQVHHRGLSSVLSTKNPLLEKDCPRMLKNKQTKPINFVCSVSMTNVM